MYYITTYWRNSNFSPSRSRSTSSPHGRKLLPAVPATAPSSSTTAAPAGSAISTIPLPDNHRMDWSALVDTATKAVTGGGGGGGGGFSEDDGEGAVKGSTQQQQQQQQQQRRTSVLLNQSSGGGGMESSSRTE